MPGPQSRLAQRYPPAGSSCRGSGRRRLPVPWGSAGDERESTTSLSALANLAAGSDVQLPE